MNDLTSKICTKCKQLKLLEEFNWHYKAKGIRQGWCRACMAPYFKKWVQENPEKKRAGNRKWAAENPEKDVASKKKWAIANPEKVETNRTKWKLENPERVTANKIKWAIKNPEKVAASQKKWSKNNPQKARAKNLKRRAAKLQRIPSWSEDEAIRQFIINCPKGMAVDHIIPLQGKLVSGLHVLSNLQYLTKKANSAKKNKFDPIAFNNLKKSNK